MAVKVTMNQNWTKVVKGDFTQEGLLEMVTDIHKRAVALAPVDTSALANSGRVNKITNGYAVRFGSSRVPYARIHELGGWTGRGHKTYIVDKHYLSRAGDNVARGDVGKYFRNKI